MCPPEYHIAVGMTVRDGAADLAAFTRPAMVWCERLGSSKEFEYPAEKPLPPDVKERFSTIEWLFDETGAGKAHKVRIKYDPDFGYPTSVFLDCQKKWPRRNYPSALATTRHTPQDTSPRGLAPTTSHVGGSSVDLR